MAGLFIPGQKEDYGRGDYTPSEDVLIERYGTSVRRVFGSSRPASGVSRPASGLPQRGQSALSRQSAGSSAGSQQQAPSSSTLPMVGISMIRLGKATQGQGSLYSNSLYSGRSAHDLDVGSTVDSIRDLHSAGRMRSLQQCSDDGSCAEGALSVGDLRALFTRGGKRSLQEKASGSSMTAMKMEAPVMSRSSPKLSSSSSGAARRSPPPPIARTRSSLAHANGVHSQMIRKAAADNAREKARLIKSQKALRLLREAKTAPSRPLSSEAPGSAESGLSGNLEAECEPDEGSEGEDWSGGVDAKKKKTDDALHHVVAVGGHYTKPKKFNPFVEFEDREQRLMNERRWLRDDDVYCHERLAGMRLTSVQANLEHAVIKDDHLYADAVFHGPYSTRMTACKREKADVLRESVSLPRLNTAASAAIEKMEEEHLEKTKKSQGDKKGAIQKDTISVKSMKAVLAESGKIIGFALV